MNRPPSFAAQLFQFSGSLRDVDKQASELAQAIFSDLYADKELELLRDDLAELVEALGVLRLFLSAAQHIADDSLGCDLDQVWDEYRRETLAEALNWLDEKNGLASA